MAELCGTGQDQTATLQALEQRCQAAEQANAAKSLFLATMSHEIREPMNGVLGMARLLLETPLSDEQQGYVEAVHESGQALLTIINDILDLSRMEAGRLELDEIEFDLAASIDRVRALIAARAAAKGLAFPVKVAADLPRLVRGDPGRLRQILINLLGNAIKFTAAGEVGLEVRPAAAGAEDIGVAIRVHDTGIGIAEHLQGQLFSAYAQADPSVPRLYGGSGLGLTICRQLARLMGGDVALASAPGVGTVFEVTLCFGRVRAPAPAPPATGQVAGCRLLVVDPNQTTRQMLEQQVQGWGVLAELVGSGAQALVALERAAAAGQPINVVLTDRSLPDMGGEELGARIKASPTVAGAQLVMMASAGLRGDAARVAALGFVAYLPKPVTATILLDCLLQLRVGASSSTSTLTTGALITAHSMAERRPAPLRILLVDDNSVNRKLASLMLGKAGHQIISAEDGAEAVQAVAGQSFDLVLMDVQMPGMNGLEATRRIRALPDGRGRLPILAVTAEAMQGDDRRCYEAGMDDYLTKPIDRARLLAKVNQWGYGRIDHA